MSDFKKFTRFSLAASAAAAALMIVAPGASAAQQAPSTAISIEAQDLGSALRTLARQTNTQVIFAPDVVSGRRAPDVTNAETPEQALKLMLRKTGLTYQATGAGTYTILAEAAAPAARITKIAAVGAPAQISENEIIVTARRRDETAQETPVAITVLNSALLDRYAIKGVASIQTLTPGLVTGEATGSVGGSIFLRGVGSSDSQPFIDQAVSTNVDGVQISSAQILRAAQMDLKQIEVLRGPQALFFGKNSPGGIISLTTADPGDEFEGMVRGGYEFAASEKYVDGTISIPLSDTLGVRLAGHYSKMDGYIDVISPPAPGVIPASLKHYPEQEEYFLRGTVKYEPNDKLTIRLKGTLTDTDIEGGPSYFSDIAACPYGAPQDTIAPVASNCSNDGTIVASQFSPAFLALSPYLGTKPHGYRSNGQQLFSGQIDYDITDALKLTSVTGYYGVKEKLVSNGGYGLTSVNGFAVRFDSEQLSEELRLASSFDSPLNFLVGGYFDTRKLYTLTYIANPVAMTQLATESTHQEQDSYSIFGQGLWDINEKVQLTVGARYSSEQKNLKDYIVRNPPSAPGIDVTLNPLYPSKKLTFDNLSPEVTLTYKPATDLMLFASYKEGFKSGGFDASYTAGAILANPRRDQTFEPEKVKGFEAGVKSSLFDRQVTLNATAYSYEYKDLQVPVFDTNARAFTTQNAAKSEVKGVELEGSYRPESVPGLSFHGTLAYNDAKFKEYLADCYNGQSASLGCNQVFRTDTNRFTSQNLAGHQLRKAPEWSATVGGYYEFPLMQALMASVSADVMYSDGYDTGTAYQPLAYQDSFTKFDATFRLFTEDKKWEFAIIGRNLTDELTLTNGIDRTGTGSGKGGSILTNPLFTGSCATATSLNCDKRSDILGTPSLPRTVAAQLTYRF